MPIVRNLIGRFGWRVQTDQLGKADRKVDSLKRKTAGLAAAAGKLGIGLGAAALAREAFKSVDESLKLGRDMAQVATLIPGATSRVVELRNAVRDLARETGTDTSDIARGVFDVISAFGDTADTMDTVRTANRAAAAGGTDTASMFKLLAAMTKGYGDTSKGAVKHAADLVFLINKLGFTDIPALSASMARQIPMANAVGVSQEELAAGTAALVGTTGNAAAVSTQLASLYRSLAKRSDTASKALKKMGFNSIKAAIKAKGLHGVLMGLRASGDGSAESMLKIFGRAEAVTAALALTTTSAQNYKDSLKATANAAGTADEAYKAMAGGLGKSAKDADKAKARFQVFRQELGDLLVADVNRAKGAFLDLATVMGGQVLPAFSAYQKAREAQLAAEADSGGGAGAAATFGAVTRRLAQVGELVAHGMNVVGINAGAIQAMAAVRADRLSGKITPEQEARRLALIDQGAERDVLRRRAVTDKNVRLLGLTPEQARRQDLRQRLTPQVSAAAAASANGKAVTVIFNGTKIEVPANTTPEQATEIVNQGVKKALQGALNRASRAHPNQTEARS